MTIKTGTNTGLMNGANEGDIYTTEMNKLLRGLDCLVMPIAISLTATPPASPADGNTYLIAASATGAWVGLDGKIARWSTALTTPAWEIYTPKKGWQAKVSLGLAGIVYEHTGTAWRKLDAVPTYADQAEAATGGLLAGELFKTSVGALFVKT